MGDNTNCATYARGGRGGATRRDLAPVVHLQPGLGVLIGHLLPHEYKGLQAANRLRIIETRLTLATLIMQLQPVFHCSPLNALDPGSGR